ncbi:putative Chymotrypsinogen 2 [Hypsibius exemplaris]|uniref:Chymotrypsinogen 2 n=1 Tax=Hypsibius exemplaris TaxID=2072580 RepID=A0A9X6NIY2_HYPEX|nr:putative Chymotrypsinogen 2 [Hypsibius exemplaris]
MKESVCAAIVYALLVILENGAVCQSKSVTEDDYDFGDDLRDDAPPVGGMEYTRSTSAAPADARNGSTLLQGDGDYGDYTVDNDISITNGSIDPAIQPNATMPSLSVYNAIIGGLPVPPHKYRFMVSLQDVDGNFHFCGGSLISSIHVITAAHCLTDEKGRPNKARHQFHVGVGMHNHKGNSNSHYFGVQRIQIHESYNGEPSYLNDIALLTLDASVTGRSQLKTGVITLPAGWWDDAPPSTTVRGIGWGLTGNAKPGIFGDAPPLLQGTHFRVLSQSDCSERVKSSVAASQICIDSSDRAACSGDSGGPLFRQLSSGNYQLLGVASYVVGSCQQQGSANVYTRVSHHVKWIKSALRSDGGLRRGSSPESSGSSGCRTTSENGMTCLICTRRYRYSKSCSGSSSYRSSSFSFSGSFSRRVYGWLIQ